MAEVGVLHARMKTRGDTFAGFADSDPVLLDRELAIVTDSGVLEGGVMVYKMKIGPGQWSLLPFVTLGAAGLSEAEVNGLIGAAMSALGTAANADTGDFEAAGAVAAHASATDPHGDRAYADGITEQATESERGTLKVARSVDMESPTTTNDVDAVTPKKWYEGFTAALGTTGFRNAVRGVLLDGLSVASSAAVTAADSILVAIGKLQAQVTALRTIGTSGMIEVAKNKSYVLIYKTASPGTVVNMQVVCDTGGTVTAAVKINGTAITGISAVSVSSTPATATATAANTYAAGATVELTLSANASAKNVRWTLEMLRTL